MSKPTESEVAFEEYCTAILISFLRIDRGPGYTPDYDITLGSQTVVTEVKQLDRTEEDEQMIAAGGGWSLPGKRVRSKFQKANKQLKERSQGKLPAMLVIFDNGTGGGTDATDIKTAMFGHETVVLNPQADGTTMVSPIHAGEKRKCTEDDNTTISAVGLLFWLGGGHRLLVFHNHFATIPINPDWFRHERFQHFGLHPDFYEWRLV
jgi:hypothetical protein